LIGDVAVDLRDRFAASIVNGIFISEGHVIGLQPCLANFEKVAYTAYQMADIMCGIRNAKISELAQQQLTKQGNEPAEIEPFVNRYIDEVEPSGFDQDALRRFVAWVQLLPC
jgi:hypothetical protein